MARRVAAACHFAFAAVAQADLTLAQIAPMSGPIGEEGKAYNLGIRVAIEQQNARGGLHGQKLDLKHAGRPVQARLGRVDPQGGGGQDPGPAAAGRLAGDDADRSRRRWSTRSAMPIVGVIPGAEPLRKPVQPLCVPCARRRSGPVWTHRRARPDHRHETRRRRLCRHPLRQGRTGRGGRLLKAAGHGSWPHRQPFRSAPNRFLRGAGGVALRPFRTSSS
jgi:hypothetical protein